MELQFLVLCSLIHSLIIALTKAQDIPPVLKVTQVPYPNTYISVKSEANLNYISSNEAEYQVPAGVMKLGLHCSAAYPISWRMESFKYSPTKVYGVFYAHRRHALNPFDYKSFNYSAGLTLTGVRNLMTGRYECHGTKNDSNYVGLHIFWKDFSGALSTTDLVRVGNNFTLLQSDLKEATVDLPCLVADPNKTVSLYAFDAAGNSRYLPGTSYTYNPKLGFTLKNWQSGYYKCQISSDKYGSMGITVPPLVNRRDTKASLTFNPAKALFKCCSGTARDNPRMYYLPCDHPLSCEYLSQISPDGIRRNRYSKSNQFVKYKNNRCTTLQLRAGKGFHMSGIVRCIGYNFDLHHPYLYSLEKKNVAKGKSTADNSFSRYGPWINWEDIIPEKMMLINKLRTVEDIKGNLYLYDGQNISVACATSMYYFAAGMLFGIQFKNGTVKFVTSPDSKWMEITDNFIMYDGHVEPVSLIATKEIDSVICMAPVWDSSEWVNKVYYVWVKDSIPPSINRTQQSFGWYVNETAREIQCNATGYPLPSITWIKDDQEIRNGTNFTVTSRVLTDKGEVRSVLRILRVSYEDCGVFTCVAESKIGNASMEFRVRIIGTQGTNHTCLIATSAVSSLLLIICIGILVWKIKQVKYKLQQLSERLRRRSPEQMREAIASDVFNQEFDTSRMGKNLFKE